jgi:hypothetical protein
MEMSENFITRPNNLSGANKSFVFQDYPATLPCERPERVQGENNFRKI